MKLVRGKILLVVDGSQMLLLRNDGDTVSAELTVLHSAKVDSLPSRRIASDAPGLCFPRAGSGRDTYGNTDPHKEAEERFLKDAAHLLNTEAKVQTGRIIIIAPPRALGVMRQYYDADVQKRLIGEIARDLINHPIAEIARLAMVH